MKRLLFGSFVLTVFVFKSCVFGDWNNGISGDGNVVTETINVDGFTGIHASSGIDVNISQGDFYVEVEADENLQEVITVELDGDMLRIDSERNIYKSKSKVVNVTLPELTDIKISSAGDIKAMTDFDCQDVDIDISSAGDLDIELDAKNVKISISSSGDCDISGTAVSLNARLSSAGDLDAAELISDFVDVSVSSAGDASVYANKEIKMSASSAGNIYYRGDAEILKSHTSSAGSIRRK